FSNSAFTTATHVFFTFIFVFFFFLWLAIFIFIVGLFTIIFHPPRQSIWVVNVFVPFHGFDRPFPSRRTFLVVNVFIHDCFQPLYILSCLPRRHPSKISFLHLLGQQLLRRNGPYYQNF